MKTRMEISGAEPRIYQVMDVADSQIEIFGITPKFIELIRLRVSQLNGCGYCITYRIKNAFNPGEKKQRVFAISAWWKTPFFTEEEQVAFRLVEEETKSQTKAFRMRHIIRYG